MSCVIDIKSGKAEPWAALQLCGYSLCNSFDVEFDEATHIYKYKGNILPSVTGILKAEGFINMDWYTDWAREKGQFVHQAVEYDIVGELDEETLDDEIRPYLSAFRKFMKESGFKVERSEVPQLSTTYHYAGKSDLYGCFPKPTAARRFALELNNEGKYKLISYKDQNDFPVWLAAVAVHHWKKNNLKGK
jgi:hypothetical protein